MSVSSLALENRRASAVVRAWDYLELTKPKIAALELVTVAVAAAIASWGMLDPWVLAHALIGTALVAASASAFNQLIERRVDARMERTADRPLPAGRLTATEVATFGVITCVAGVAYLGLAVGLPTALCGLMTWFLYVGVYTPMKTRTPLNTVVGAVAGAGPVLMGWTAAGAPLNLSAATLFMIVFLWQFPHFMAIAWIYRRQYAAAGLKMLPVVDATGRRAGAQAVSAALALVPVSLLPAVIGAAGPVYFAWALLLGLAQLACAVWFAWRMNETTARWLLRASLVYLPAVLAMMVAAPLL